MKDTAVEAGPVCGTDTLLLEKRVLFWQLRIWMLINWRWFREEPQGLHDVAHTRRHQAHKKLYCRPPVLKRLTMEGSSALQPGPPYASRGGIEDGSVWTTIKERFYF